MRLRSHRTTGAQEGVWFNISSGAGLTCVPGYAGYVASKHAEIGLTKNAALDFADRGVRVNAACPGLVNTPLIADMVTDNPEMHGTSLHPTRSAASPSPRNADSIVLLATSKSIYVAGVALPVDGGYLTCGLAPGRASPRDSRRSIT